MAAALLSLPAFVNGQTFHTEKHNIGGDGAFDYLSVDPTNGHVFVSRGTHIMVVDGASGSAVGDIKDTPRTHGAAIVTKYNRGFSTNGGDSTSSMFDLNTLQVIKKIPAGMDGLDGFMYDDFSDKVLTIDHSRPDGTAIVIDPKSGDVVGKVMLSSNAPEGGVSDGKGHIYINLENKNSIDVVNAKTWKVEKTWSIEPCDGPTGIAMDRETNRIFAGCSKTSVVIDAGTGKVVAQIPNGDGVDALGWDQSQKLMYIPAGQSGNVTVVHEDSPDKYSVIATVPTMAGARTIAVDPAKHVAYTFAVEYGPPPAGTAPPAGGRGRGPRGPGVGAWLITIQQ